VVVAILSVIVVVVAVVDVVAVHLKVQSTKKSIPWAVVSLSP
jgi:hypothetical protein